MNTILKNKKVISIVCAFIAIIAILLAVKQINNKTAKLDIETMRAMNYEQLTEDKEFVENSSNNIKFSAFFTKDLNGDGKAEKLLGSCKEIGYNDTLYMDINVLNEGYLKGGIIRINHDNFTYSMQMVKDTVLKNNYVSSNVENIELNDIYAGTQKLIMGTTNAQIKYKDSYSANNTVTLEGIYVNNNGEETPVSKTINLTLDWYGTANAKLSGYSTHLKQSELFSDDKTENPVFNFKFQFEETKKQLLINEQNIDVILPNLYGYYPTNVYINSPAILPQDYTYDEESHALSIKNITSLNSTTYELSVIYPDEAYAELKEQREDIETVNLIAKINGYFKCYNNPNEEFENPYISNEATTISSVIISTGGVVDPSHQFGVAFKEKTYLGKNEYVMSKKELLDAYDSKNESEKLNYTVCWSATRIVGDVSPTTIIMRDTYQGGDKFDAYDLSEYVSNIGIYFSADGSLIPSNGTVSVYNDDTNELIKEFKNGEWKNIQQGNIFYYETPVKHIRIETSEDQTINANFVVNNVKELDIAKLRKNLTREDIENISKFTTPIEARGSNIKNVTTGRDSVNLVTAKSYNLVGISPDFVSTVETEPTNEIITITIPKSNPAYADWENGTFLVEFPSKIIYANLNDITIDNSSVKLDGYELYKENGKYFIKVLTSTTEPVSDYKIQINCGLLADPMSSASREHINVYSYNEYCDMYFNTTKDIYDLNGDGNLSDIVGIEKSEISITAPSAFVSTETVSNYNESNEITVAPNIAEVTRDTREATINIEYVNNYLMAVSDIEILGKVPFKGNTYVNGTSLNSEFTATMKDGGITVPTELQEVTTIYYSDNENPNKDLNDNTNNWKLAKDIDSFENVKSYLIKINSDNIIKGKKYTFNYNVKIPENITANFATYACHSVYFNLHTDGGTLETSVQPNKVGIRITRYYDIELMKYKGGTTRGVEKAKYQLSWAEDDEKTGTKIAISTSEGILRFKNLRANEVYTLKEISAPNYETNTEEIKFKVVETEDKQLTINILEGSFGKTPVISQNSDGKDVLKTCVYDLPKVSLNITKIDNETSDKLTGVIFELKEKGSQGKEFVTSNGNIQITGLSIGKTYILKEKYAKGYYLIDDAEFTIKLNNEGNLYIESNNPIFDSVVITNNDETDLAQVDLTISNIKIPTYNLQIVKIDENNEETKLSNAKFLLSNEDIGNAEYYTTNDDGIIKISGLYQYVEGKNITGKYTLQETEAPSGYILNKEKISFVASKNKDGKLEITIENKENLNTVYDAIIEDEENIKLIIQNKSYFKTTKIDAETKEPLANAEFIIYELNSEDGTILDYAKDVNGEYIGTQNEKGNYIVKTNEKGVLTAALRNGTYKIIETKYPEGYEEKQVAETFTITGNKPTKTNEDTSVPETEMVDETTKVLEISYIEDLVDLQKAVNEGKATYADTTVKLTRTLDFNSDDSYKNPNDTSYGDERGIKTQLTDKSGKGFTPIGINEDSGKYCFEGIFDGQGNRLENIYINHDECTGLFGYIKVLRAKDLGITGTVIGNSSTGSLCGYVEDYAYVDNCYSECTVEATKFDAGGLIGWIENKSASTIKNCNNKGSIAGEGYVGGIVGQICYSNQNRSDVYIINCHNEGSITGKNFVAGIIGDLIYVNKVYVKKCSNTGAITENIEEQSNGIEIGGIIGELEAIEIYIYDSYNTGDISAPNSSYVGGIIGQTQNDNNKIMIINCYNTGNIAGAGYIGGILGNDFNNANSINIDNCYNTGNISGDNVGGICGYVNKINIANCYNTGKISIKNSTNTAYGSGGIIGYGGSTITQCYNIGNIECLDGYHTTLRVGGLIGYGSSNVKKCYNEGNINVNSDKDIYCGGIVGDNPLTVEDCYNAGSITINCNSHVSAGGISGFYGTFNNCSNTGDITVHAEGYAYIGGIIAGSNPSNVYRCSNSGNINVSNSGYSYIGGIACQGSVAQSYNTGNITHSVTGSANNNYYIGGILSYSSNNSNTVTFSYNTGNITNTMNITSETNVFIGGIIGDGVPCSNVYNTGNIENYVQTDKAGSRYYVGGISGNQNQLSNVYTYNTGSVYNNITGHDTSSDTISTNPTCISSAPYNYYRKESNIVGSKGKDIASSTAIALSDEYMRSEEFYNILKTTSSLWKHIDGQYPILDIATTPASPKVTELTIENTKKQFDITTEISKNKSGNRDGGTITGDYNEKYIESNIKKYIETVKYGNKNTQSIEIKPNDGYVISKITVNGNPIDFQADDQGKYVIKSGSLEIKGDYHIAVTFEKESEQFTLNKVNEQGEKLANATFRIESDSLAQSMNLKNNNKYYFDETEDGYVPNNIGTVNTVANSYIEIDLRGLTGKYYVSLDAILNGPGTIYAAVNQNVEALDYNNQEGCFLYTSANGRSQTFKSELIDGGKLYYLHLGYFTNYLYPQTIAKISNIKTFAENDVEISKYIIEKTDKNGQIKKTLSTGNYKIIEIEAPEGYKLNSDPVEFTMEANKSKEITVVNKKLSNVMVHYYLDKTGKEFNNDPVVIKDDVVLTGNLGTEYVSSPYMNIGEYTLKTDGSGEYVIPDNASGKFKEQTINVYYYYNSPTIEGKYNLTITKVNQENVDEKVPGAKFEIFEGDTKVGELTDDNNDGIYESGDITVSESGTEDITKNITIKETAVPTGFVKISDITGTITFEKAKDKNEYIVKESSFGTVKDGNISFTVKEPKLKGTYSLQITKVDEEGNKIPGAEFTVFEDTTEVAKLTDDNNDGIYESTEIGISEEGTKTITIEETTVPTGYLKANNITGTITSVLNDTKEKYIITESTLGNVSDDGLIISLEVLEEKVKEEKYDLAIKKFVSAIDGKKITTREPKVEVSEDGTIKYIQNDKIEEVANNQIVTYTLRIYNESKVNGKGKQVVEHIPDGLVFLPEMEINKKWEMYVVNQDGTWTKTNDPKKATIVATDYLANKEIPAFDGKDVMYEDVEVSFKVDETKLTSKDRIIENTVEMKNNNLEPGDNDPDDNPANDKTTEKLYVKYFDLSLKKYIKQIVATYDNKIKTVEVAKESQNDLKIKLNKSIVNRTTLAITYVLEIKNVGEIEGCADKISEHIPEEFKLEDSKAIWSIDGNIAKTDSLKNLVIKPGETKKIEVVCTWKLSENTSGVKTNRAKIEEYSNPHDSTDLVDDDDSSDSDIEIIIVNDKYDLAIKKFISAIDNKELTTRIPKVEISEDGKITYTQNNEIEKVANNQEVTYTLRMYNESDVNGKGKRVIEYIPDGLVFLPENETNKKYNWVMFKEDENGKFSITENAEEAVIVTTDYLVNKEIKAFDKDTDTDLSYLDVQAVFKVDETKLTSEDRIVENRAKIMPNENDDYPENDESTEKIYVKYFDLSIEKYIDEVKVNTNGKENTIKVGYDKKDQLVKIDVKRSNADKTKLTVTYGLLVKNVGEIAGYATEIKDYIPKDFKVINSENWKLEGNEAINTQLENVILEPGESTTVYITCEWKLSEESIGERYNEAEISKYRNNYDAIDVTDDNKDKEGLLVTLKTGSELIGYIIVTLTAIVTIGLGIVFIKRKV